MAAGYLIDPTTGLPMLQTPGGYGLPVPLTEDDLRAAGAQFAGPPRMGPDLRVAGPGGGMPELPPEAGIPGQFGGGPQAAHSWQQDLAVFNTPPAAAGPAPAELAQQQAMQAQGHISAEEQAKRRASSAYAASQASKPLAPGGGAVDPSTLARPQSQQAAATQGGPEGLDDPLIQQAMAEAMRGGGGGGPRRLGVTSETHKLTQPQAPVDPVLGARAADAQGASDKYGEQLAQSLNVRQQQAYEAQQGEYAARAGQLQAQQERFDHQQTLLRDYQAKRDELAAEAAQMKAPQMEDYWGSRSVMAKMATALSITLGGALQGLRGGQNPGLEMSNQEIDRWISGQREMYERARGKVNDADNQYARMVQTFGSENLAIEHLREQAWTVRDNMLKSYAEKIGTPSALENYNQAMLQTEAERAALQARASQGAMVEIEQRLNMQGGGGGQPGVLKMLRAGAEARKLRDVISGGDDKPTFQREVQNEKVEGITGALEAIEAADEVEHIVSKLGATESDFDNPLSGPADFVAGLAGGERRNLRQRLDQQTALLARGIQQSLGKSDNDARLADDMAEGGGSGKQRLMAAQTARQRATGRLQNIVSSLTPQQQAALIQSLRANSPARAAQVEAAIGATATPQTAASEQAVP